MSEEVIQIDLSEDEPVLVEVRVGPKGERGEIGPIGPQGIQGEPGYAPYLIKDKEVVTIPAGKQVFFTLPIEIEGGGALTIEGALIEI